MNIILASQSPRRKELLSNLVQRFSVQSADIDETPLVDESAHAYVARLAEQKAQVIAKGNNDAIVIGSDTAVVIDGQILGKPSSLNDSQRMLQLLSGKTHQVMTGFSVINGDVINTQVVTTDVTFKTLTSEEIDAYWRTNEPQDKAGSYAIQGIGGKFVERINGSVSSVIGLPLVELDKVLKSIL